MSGEEINLWQSSGAMIKESRRVGRAVSRQQGSGQLRVSAVDVETDVVEVKIENYTEATGRGMGAVSRVGRLERALVLNDPELSGRLAQLGEAHAMEVSDLLGQYASRIRRI